MEGNPIPDITKFQCRSVLGEEITEKKVNLLGRIQGREEEGEAIFILTPKLLTA